MSVNIDMGIIPKKKIEVNKLMVKILVYSAIKMRAKLPALNSTLKPETNSDSPSDRSKGVRFVSAKDVINQIMNKGGNIKATQDHWEEVIRIKLKDKRITKALSKVRAILTSYEMVWAILRIAPSRAYFELEDQPADRVA